MTAPYDAREHARNPHLVPIFQSPPEPDPNPEEADDA